MYITQAIGLATGIDFKELRLHKTFYSCNLEIMQQLSTCKVTNN